MGKHINKKNVGLIVFGIIVAFIFGELLLRLSGLIYQGIKLSLNESNGKKEGTYTILCVGDSFTFGYGAPQGKSYPAQLQQLLNLEKKEGIFKVVNKGIPGQNTSELLAHLQAAIDTIKPDLIILLIGNNNGFWNLWGYSKYKNEKTAVSLLKNYFYTLRLYKVLKMCILTIKAKMQKNNLYRGDAIHYRDNYNEKINVNKVNKDEKEVEKKERLQEEEKNKSEDSDLFRQMGYSYNDKIFEKAPSWFKKEISKEPDNGSHYNKLGLLFKKSGLYSEALQCFIKGIMVDPGYNDNYRDIGWIYYYEKQDYKEAIRWFKRAIEVNRFDGDSYAGIGYAYRKLGQYKDALMWIKKGILACSKYHRCYACLIVLSKEINTFKKKEMFNNTIAFLKENKKIFPEIRKYEDLIRQKENIYTEINKWVESDLYKIVELCKKHNITIILQNYPRKKRLANILKRFAEQHSIPFVDNYYLFNELTKQSGNKEAYFLSDGIHCNTRGYGMMAKTIYNTLIKEEIIVKKL